MAQITWPSCCLHKLLSYLITVDSLREGGSVEVEVEVGGVVLEMLHLWAKLMFNVQQCKKCIWSQAMGLKNQR